MKNEEVGPLKMFWAALQLGLISFGGPVTHIANLRRGYVTQREWVTEEEYGEILALSSAIPGPSSSEIGVAIGLRKAGLPGAILSWIGFTLPAATLMISFGLIVQRVHLATGLLTGLALGAVAVVANAVLVLSQTLAPTPIKKVLALIFLVTSAYFAVGIDQLVVIVAGALIGAWLFRKDRPLKPFNHPFNSKVAGLIALSIFAGLLFGLPIAASIYGNTPRMFDVYYRTGALVFGGGHVMLPLLHARVVLTHWVTNQTFLAGYGLAQAMPGPLFSFAGFLGAASVVKPNGLLGGMFAIFFIFLPGFLLIVGITPFWNSLRNYLPFVGAFDGINVAVLGILGWTFINPVISSSVHNVYQALFAALAFLLLRWTKTPVPLVIAGCAVIGFFFF